ncbi:hypothetical protein D3C75_508600 [compost metagenome]
MGIGVALGRQAGDGFEHAMEVEAAQARRLGQFAQGGQRLRAFDLAARGGHGGGMLRGEFALILRRAFARTITRGPGLFGAIEEFDIVWLGQAREAAGVAVDACGLHGIDKLPVSLGIARNHGGPARIVFSGDFGRSGCHGVTSIEGLPAH